MKQALKILELTAEAEMYLLTVWDMIQAFDDWNDGDKVGDPFGAIWHSLATLPACPFLAANREMLVPVMANMVLKWRAANDIEDNREKEHYPKSYMWRAGYYDLILQVVLIVHGVNAKDYATTVLRLYGETLAEYEAEFA